MRPAGRDVMRRLAIMMAVILALASVPVQVEAHYLDWTPSYKDVKLLTGYCTRTCYDTVAPRTIQSWNSTRTANLHHMLLEYDDFFTHDARDLSNNINATGSGYTDIEQPYYDIDDDNGDRKWEESEVTSQWQLFPRVGGHYYYSRLYFMHWWRSCSQCAWQWDPDGGNAQQVDQLSFESCPIFCDKYDADPDFNSYVLGTNSYPYLPQQGSAATVEEEALSAIGRWQDALAAPPTAPPAPSLLASSMRLGVTYDPGEVLVIPDLAGGLEAYRSRAARLAGAVAEGGPALGVVTFSRPLSEADLARLSDLGLQILSIEAVTEMYDGVRGTYFGPYSPSVWSQMSAIAEEFSTSFLGVTSAQVLVPNAAVLAAASGSPDVYLIDLSMEQARRTTGKTDIVMNDLYWQLAGWL